MLKSLAFVSFSLLFSSAYAMTDAQLARAMRAEFEKNLVTVKSPKLIFHWVDASDVNPPGQYNTEYPSTSTHFQTYVEKQGKRIYNRRNRGDADIAGPGLYMAAGPIISRSYGGEKSFGLIVGLIRPGARLVPSHTTLTINAQIASEIVKRGCSDASDYLSLLDTYEPACIKVKQLLVGKDISFADGRLYAWATGTIPGCSDTQPERDIVITQGKKEDYTSLDTFVAYNPNLFSKIYGYTHKTKLSGDKLADEVLSYLKGIEALGLYNGLISQQQMKDPAIQAMSAAQVKSFSQKYAFGCTP